MKGRRGRLRSCIDVECASILPLIGERPSDVGRRQLQLPSLVVAQQHSNRIKTNVDATHTETGHKYIIMFIRQGYILEIFYIDQRSRF